MSKSQQDRRANRTGGDEVAEIEGYLWEFAHRPDPPAVPEALLRPGAFLYRVHRAWHTLGRGTGLASHSFRALKEELLRRDPPVRNLQPKLYGHTALSLTDASHLIDVMVETWHVARGRGGNWEATPLLQPRTTESKRSTARSEDLDAIRENLLHTLFKGEDSLLLEEPVGVPPEIFLEERGQGSLALIIATKSETTAHLSPSNLYGGFSEGVGRFFDAAEKRQADGQPIPLLIWILKLRSARNNAEFHQEFHSLAVYSACLTNWFFRFSCQRGDDRKRSETIWRLILGHSAFVVHGLPEGIPSLPTQKAHVRPAEIDRDLADLDPTFFLPDPLPIAFKTHRYVKRHPDHSFSLNVSIEPDHQSQRPLGGRLNYWLFPNQPQTDLQETAETTGLPVFDAGMSPGKDSDAVFTATYEAVLYRLGFTSDKRSKLSFATLKKMGWNVLTIREFQERLLVPEHLKGRDANMQRPAKKMPN